VAEPWTELTATQATLIADTNFGKETAAQMAAWKSAGRDNAGLSGARLALHPLADRRSPHGQTLLESVYAFNDESFGPPALLQLRDESPARSPGNIW
jgi:hypothetical protein